MKKKELGEERGDGMVNPLPNPPHLLPRARRDLGVGYVLASHRRSPTAPTPPPGGCNLLPAPPPPPEVANLLLAAPPPGGRPLLSTAKSPVPHLPTRSTCSVIPARPLHASARTARLRATDGTAPLRAAAGTALLPRTRASYLCYSRWRGGSPHPYCSRHAPGLAEPVPGLAAPAARP